MLSVLSYPFRDYSFFLVSSTTLFCYSDVMCSVDETYTTVLCFTVLLLLFWFVWKSVGNGQRSDGRSGVGLAVLAVPLGVRVRVHVGLDGNIGIVGGQVGLLIFCSNGSSEERLAADPWEEVVTERKGPYTPCYDAGIVHGRRVGVDISRAEWMSKSGGQDMHRRDLLSSHANSQAKDDTGKDHPDAGDGRARFGESTEMPWAGLKVLLREQAAGDRDTVGNVGSQNGQGEDRAEKG